MNGANTGVNVQDFTAYRETVLRRENERLRAENRLLRDRLADLMVRYEEHGRW